jgi:hypothetical protein
LQTPPAHASWIVQTLWSSQGAPSFGDQPNGLVAGTQARQGSVVDTVPAVKQLVDPPPTVITQWPASGSRAHEPLTQWSVVQSRSSWQVLHVPASHAPFPGQGPRVAQDAPSGEAEQSVDTHLPSIQYRLPPHVPHDPPHPSGPQVRPEQRGLQDPHDPPEHEPEELMYPLHCAHASRQIE